MEEGHVVETMRRGRLAEYAYDYTKRLLFDGTFAPGTKLRVEDIVMSLHTSRQPVMDAFKRLAAEGYLEITPQVGCRVVVPESAEVADFFLILGAVLGLAADCAAERRSSDEVLRLENIAKHIDTLSSELPESSLGPNFRRLDLEFQHQLRTMAHSDTVSRLAAGLLDRREFYVGCVVDDKPAYLEGMHAIHGQHEGIVEAIAARDPERSRARTEALVLTFARLTLGTLPSRSVSASS